MAERGLHQADALKAVEALGGGILPAKMVGGRLEPFVAHHLMPGQSIWQASARTPDAIRRAVPSGHQFGMLHVLDDGAKTGIPVVNEYDPAARSWRRLEFVLNYSVQPTAPSKPPREEVATDRPVEPTADELRTKLKDTKSELRSAVKIEKELSERASALAAELDAFDNREDQLIIAKRNRKDQLSHDFAAGSKSDLSEYDAEIATLAKEVDSKRDDAEAATAALQGINRSLEIASKRRADCERRVTNAVAQWAMYEQAEAITGLKNELERVGVCIANLAAIDSLMAEGNFGHLTKADAYLRELSNPFVGQFALDGKPSWASCRSPSQLPGVAEAREHILARLSDLEAE